MKLNSTQKLGMRGFWGHFPHSKMGIFKKIVRVLFEKIDFRVIFSANFHFEAKFGNKVSKFLGSNFLS
jgi:hypothetical protein